MTTFSHANTFTPGRPACPTRQAREARTARTLEIHEPSWVKMLAMLGVMWFRERRLGRASGTNGRR